MKAIGIDLGTTNSAAAYCDPDRRDPRILSTSAGENLTPSVVTVRRRAGDPGTSDILVGRPALNYAIRAPEDTIFSIKRLMGRDASDPQIEEIANRFNYRIVPGPDDDPRAHVLLAEEVYSPAQISTLILEKIKKDAATALGDEVTHAVITVPAYFNEGQRSATREAGEAAGLVVKKIIDEPTAAALAFGVQAQEGERLRILVYDMGGGTFDISILQMVKNDQGQDHFVLMQVEGDNWLGGDDFDRQIVDRVVAWVEEQTGEDPASAGDKRFLLLAKEHAEKAKLALSGAEDTDIVIPAAYRSSAGVVVDVEMTVRRSDFEQMIQPFVDRSMALVQKALGEQELEPGDISDVLLVGGSTLTPLIYRTVEGFFGEGKVRRTQPMECVALGAGILATTLRGVECPNCQTLNDESATICKNEECGHSLASGRSVGEGTTIDEVTAMSLGIAAVEGDRQDVFVPIIPKGTSYPLREPMRKLFEPTGRKIRVPVYEGDDEIASRNAEQGVVEHELPEDIELDSPVEVVFNYDRHRQLTVTIKVPNTDFYKTTTLLHDQPRTAAPAAGDQAEPDDWEDELAATLEFAHRFVEHYGNYMDRAESVKLKRNLDRAAELLDGSPNPKEGRRMKRILDLSVFNAGLATQLFLADQAVERATPETSRQLNEVASTVRQSHQLGDHEALEDQTRYLKTLVAQALQQQSGVETIGDQEDYQGLLRLLRQ